MHNLTKVKMEQLKCVQNDLIGTQAIASCIGVILYDWFSKKAIVGHFNSNMYDGFEVEDAIRIYSKLHDEALKSNFSNNVSYLIIPGIVGNKERIKKVSQELEGFLKDYKKMEIDNDFVKINEATESLEFVFDANSGTFKTSTFYPNDINYSIEYKKQK